MDGSVTTLYDTTSVADAGAPNPFPPGTIETAVVETIDNDRADLLLDAGIVR